MSVVCIQLLGGPTKIQLRLTGFDGTNKHGFYVHQVGSTEDKCRASGEQNNPQDKANGGLDDERSDQLSFCSFVTVSEPNYLNK